MYNDSTSWLVHGRSAHLRASVRLALGTSPRQQSQSDSRRASGAFFAQSSVVSRSGAYEVAPFTMSCLRRALCWSLAFSSSVWWCKAVMSWSLQLIQTNNQYHINHYEDHWHDSNGLRHLG